MNLYEMEALKLMKTTKMSYGYGIHHVGIHRRAGNSLKWKQARHSRSFCAFGTV